MAVATEVEFASSVSAWVEPSGRHHVVVYAGHYSWALAHGHGDDAALERKGWLHLSGGFVRGDTRPTQAQIDKVFDLWMLYEESMSKGPAQYGAALRNTLRTLVGS